MEKPAHAVDAAGEDEELIWAEMFDAGTTLVIDPLDETPGMDSAYYRALDMEYQFPGQLQAQINQYLVDTPLSGFLRPWPDGFPWRMWMDYTDRLRGDYGGPHFDLFHWDDISGDFEPVPAPTATVITATVYDPGTYRDDARVTDWFTSEEVVAAEGSSDPTTWLRLPLRNEPGGRDGHNCELLNRVVINQFAQAGPHYKMVGDYNPIFAPFDLRHPEWYDIIDSQGFPYDPGASPVKKEQLISLLNDNAYKLYVRPANWRWAVTVTAYYYYVSWFEFFLTKQIFTHAYFDRPPIYPIRHNYLHTSRTATIEWDHSYWSQDAGIDDGFERSRGSQFLRDQIIDAQWWTYSEAFIFARNDPAKIHLWLWPPESGDIVLGISTADRITGQESIFWLRQNQDLTHVYQRQVIGSYLDLGFAAAGSI